LFMVFSWSQWFLLLHKFLYCIRLM
jgi:hypothetical protein